MAAAEQNAQPAEPAAPAKSSDGVIEKVGAFAFPFLVLTFVFISWLPGALGVGRPRLEVVTSATRDSIAKTWTITGRVLLRDEGRAMHARVWAIAVDSTGNRYSPGDTVADDAGQFRLAPIPVRLGGDSTHQVTDVTVHASAVSPGDSTHIQGEENLRLSSGRVRWVEPSPVALLSIGVIFFFTLVIGLIQPRSSADLAKKTKYFTLVVLSFLFTLTMIVLIAVALRNVNSNSGSGDVMSLGFANIYSGTYVKEVPAEWLFSLTAPRSPSVGGLATGFGIPLWLLLIAVLGSGVYTIALLVRHVREPLPEGDDRAYRDRVGELVSHQFYMLFSPLGAILVYQLLIAAGAGAVQVTVALAIFAAGVTANAVLDKAVRTVQQFVGAKTENAPAP